MRAPLPATLLALLLLAPAAASAADPLTDGRRLYARGKYAEAETRLRKALRGPTRAEARLVLADLLLLRGQVQEAEGLAREALGEPGAPAEAGVLLAQALVRRGAHDEAIRHLRAVVEADREAHTARALLGETLAYLGKDREARRVLEPMVARDDTATFRTARDLVALGRAARVLGQTRFAFQAFDDATMRDPACVEAHLWLGLTALDKLDTVHAEQGFAAALKVQPRHPLAHVGRARVELEVARTHAKALEHLDQAEAVDPGLPEARRLRAAIELEGEHPEEALRILDEVLADNPRDLEALSVKAAAYEELLDDKGFSATLSAVRKVRKRYAGVYTAAARHAVRRNRFEDAIRLAERALKVDPDHLEARAILGLQYTRVGQEDRGRRHLERTYERDDYNVRVTNLLNLYERWLPDYVWVEDPDVRLRVHKDEAEVARRVVLPFAREMLARYDERYGFEAPRPVTLELFHKPNLFALRSVGLPGVGSHGQCFGRVVTARSPSSNDFNWGMVVAHELAHVYALVRSGHRVPRWFTEGLSEYETNVLRPEWTREFSQELFHALHAGRLPGVLDLSRAFTQGRSLKDVVVTYQLASLTMHHLVETAGYPAVVGALGRFRKGERLPAVLKAITGVEPAAFDARFREWLAARLAPLASNWDLDQEAYREVEPLRKAVKERPDDPEALAALAAHFLVTGRPEQALANATRALERRDKLPLAQFVAGSSLLRLDRPQEAKPHLEAMVEAGHDGYGVRMRLVAIARKAGRADELQRHLEKAAQWDPDRGVPHFGLAGLSERAGDAARAAHHHERAAMLDENDPDPSRALARLALRQKDTENALRWTEHARFIAPFDPEVHRLRAAAAFQAHRDDEAWQAAEIALNLDADDAEALAVLSMALLRLGRPEEAARAARRALAHKPDLEGALEVLRKLEAAP